MPLNAIIIIIIKRADVLEAYQTEAGPQFLMSAFPRRETLSSCAVHYIYTKTWPHIKNSTEKLQSSLFSIITTTANSLVHHF